MSEPGLARFEISYLRLEIHVNWPSKTMLYFVYLVGVDTPKRGFCEAEVVKFFHQSLVVLIYRNATKGVELLLLILTHLCCIGNPHYVTNRAEAFNVLNDVLLIPRPIPKFF